MPPKKHVESRSKPAENDLLLQYGPRNNIISWRDRMEEECVEMYGMTGTFFTTNKAYHIPYPIERDFHPFPDMLSDIESDSDDGTNERAVAPAVPTATSTDGGEEEATTTVMEQTEEVAPEVSKASKALIAKMRENAYEARRKKVELQELNLTKMWPYLTNQMSPSSLAKVREFPGYEEAKVSRDVIKLWGFIRRSHLTHVHGSSDKLRAVNINDQLRKFNNMRQGDCEGTPEFKSRYDN
jgi:hypothetical protein